MIIVMGKAAFGRVQGDDRQCPELNRVNGVATPFNSLVSLLIHHRVVALEGWSSKSARHDDIGRVDCTRYQTSVAFQSQ